jgi:type IV pilus assembly protein PilW
MSITYGLLAPAVDSSNMPIDAANVFSQSIQGFVTADRVTNWNQVGSVRICLIMRSANDGVATAPQNYFGCNGTKLNVAPTDRRLRSAYISTVAIRGRTIGAGS